MTAGLGLDVILGVPIRVKDDDSVGRGKVDAHPARARGEEHDEERGVGFLVLVDFLEEQGREGGREGGRVGGKEGGREGGREGGVKLNPAARIWSR